jgi:uncharacterized protein with PIN domain
VSADRDGAPRFLVDGMAVRLGKYLRCLGFDAAWELGAGTRRLALRAAEEGRVLLTRNTRAGEAFRPPPAWIRLVSEDAVEQLRQVVDELGLDVRAGLFTRCIRCNVALEELETAVAHERVQPGVRERHRRFWTCPRCHTVFWWGTHVANTCRKLGIEPPAAP